MSAAQLFRMATFNNDAKKSRTDVASLKRENTDLVDNITQMRQEVASFGQMNKLLQKDNEML